MQMYGMVGHGQVAYAYANPVVQAHIQTVNPRKNTAVPCPQIEIGHGHDVGPETAGLNVIRVHQKTKIPLHLADQRVRLTRVCDPHAHHAHGHLRHLVRMRVVHEGTCAARDKLVNKCLAGLYAFLGQSRDAVHAVGYALAVPVHAGVFRQFVGHKNSHLVTFDNFNRRARALPVVTP